MGGPALRSRHPGTDLPWGMVARVLPVPALQVSDPVAVGVLVKPDDYPLHQLATHWRPAQANPA